MAREKAAEDLRAARILTAAGQDVYSAACFHCQQAAEKALKALLVARETVPPHIHNLITLMDALAEVDLPGDLRPACGTLSDYAVVPRYPGPRDPGRSEAEAAVDLAASVVDGVGAVLAGG